MTLTQQWRYLNLTRNSFFVLFPVKRIMSYRHTISSRLYVLSKGTYSLASRALLNTGEWITWRKCLLFENSQNVSRTVTKRSRRVTCGPRIWDPCRKPTSLQYWSLFPVAHVNAQRSCFTEPFDVDWLHIQVCWRFCCISEYNRKRQWTCAAGEFLTGKVMRAFSSPCIGWATSRRQRWRQVA